MESTEGNVKIIYREIGQQRVQNIANQKDRLEMTFNGSGGGMDTLSSTNADKTASGLVTFEKHSRIASESLQHKQMQLVSHN